jgi:hypothetical protein
VRVVSRKAEFVLNLSKILPAVPLRREPALALCGPARYISGEFPDMASGGVACARGRIRAGIQGFPLQ